MAQSVSISGMVVGPCTYLTCSRGHFGFEVMLTCSPTMFFLAQVTMDAEPTPIQLASAGYVGIAARLAAG